MPRIESKLFYTKAIKKHGLVPQGLCWLSYAHQQIRFEAISSLLPQDLNNCSLIDAGCGFGDFYTFLQNNTQLPKQYIGIDNIDIMCKVAKQKTKQKIIHADITNSTIPVSDYVICSGAMNILTPFETKLFIKNCFSSATKAFIFNILYGEKISQNYNSLTKQKITKIAKELAVCHIEFRQEYLENDITVGFFK